MRDFRRGHLWAAGAGFGNLTYEATTELTSFKVTIWSRQYLGEKRAVKHLTPAVNRSAHNLISDKSRE